MPKPFNNTEMLSASKFHTFFSLPIDVKDALCRVIVVCEVLVQQRERKFALLHRGVLILAGRG